MDISRVFHDFQGCFQSVSRRFQENFKGVSKKVPCCMALIAASRAEGGLVVIVAHIVVAITSCLLHLIFEHEITTRSNNLRPKVFSEML